MSWRIEVKTEEWPWPQMTALRGKPAWLEVTEGDYWYSLEVLPPIYLAGGFQVGEPAAHAADGHAIRATFVTTGRLFGRGGGARYFAAELTRREFPRARAGLIAALKVSA